MLTAQSGRRRQTSRSTQPAKAPRLGRLAALLLQFGPLVMFALMEAHEVRCQSLILLMSQFTRPLASRLNPHMIFFFFPSGVDRIISGGN